VNFAVCGGGPVTLVLTHGLAASTETWKAQVDDLARRHRVVAWDLRGHGGSPVSPPLRSGGESGRGSDRPGAPLTLEDLANDLLAVLDASRTERAAILGHSAGGVIAMQFALQHPERTAGLILVGTASECNKRAHRFYEDLAAAAEGRGMASVHKRLGLGADFAGPAANPIAFAKVARCMGNLYHAPLTPRLAEIRCPTLIIVGEKDFLGAGGSVILSRRIAGSELHIVPERGHGIFLEDPQGFNALVDRFLGGIDRERA
jgi:pimeloyl-ACP methyl ester carboxylesterase